MKNTMNINSKYHLRIPHWAYLSTGFIVAFILRVVLNLNNSFPVIKDAKAHLLAAESIASGYGFAYTPGKPTAFGLPAYPFFLAIIRICFGNSIFFIQLGQAFLGALTCLIIYFITLETFDRRVANIAFIIMTFYHFLIKHSGFIYLENLYIFFICLSMLFLVKILKKPEKRINYIIFGGLFALVILTNCGAFFFPFLMAIVILFKFRKNKVFSNLIIMLTVFMIPLLAWSARNYFIFNKFIFLGTQGGGFFYSSWAPREGKIYGFQTRDKQGEAITSEEEKSRYYYKKGLEVILSNPKRALRLLALKNLYFWSVFDWETLGNGTYNFSTAFILPFLIASFFFIKKKDIFYMLPFIMLIAYYVILTNVFMGLPRYRIQIEPFLIILSSYAIVSWYSKSHNKRIFILAISTWLLVNLFMFANSGLVKSVTKYVSIRIGIW